jgi:hypothetical protein
MNPWLAFRISIKYWTVLLGLCIGLVGCSQPATQVTLRDPTPIFTQPAFPTVDPVAEELTPTQDPIATMIIPEDSEPGNLKPLPQVLLVSPVVMWEFLEQNVGTIGFGGKVFCAYEVLASQEGVGGQVEEYQWVVCQEYYKSDGTLTKGSGISLPMVVFLQSKGETYQIASYSLPGDGEDYAKFIQGTFPERLWPQIFPSDQAQIRAYNQRAARLEAEAERRATAYFKANP